jgi:hypothetical protein
MTPTTAPPVVESSPALDILLDHALIESRLESGVAPAQAVGRSRLRSARTLARQRPVMKKTHVWSDEEKAFLRANLGRLSEEEIAQRLGRTVVAVHLHWKRELRLCAPSKRPDELTANQIANGLGLDEHKITGWVDGGLLRGRRLPGRDITRVVLRVTLLRWLVNPEHWMLFRAEAVGVGCKFKRGASNYDQAFWAHARRLLDRARERWDDEWWTSRQVADYRGVDPRDVARRIALGQFPAVQVRNYGGRHPNPYWAYWFVRRSVATDPALVWLKGKGAGHDAYWSPAESAFVLLAAAVGFSYSAIARLTGDHRPSEAFRIHITRLHRVGAIPGLIRQYKLKIRYRRKRGNGAPLLFADWKDYRQRFPSLARAMTRLRRNEALTKIERCDVRSVLCVWATWGGARATAHSLIGSGQRRTKHFRAIVQSLRTRGIDPYRRWSRR